MVFILLLMSGQWEVRGIYRPYAIIRRIALKTDDPMITRKIKNLI